MTVDLDNLDHLDDPTPPAGLVATVQNLAADRSGRRRRTLQRRAGSLAVAGALITTFVAIAVTIPDGSDDIDIAQVDTTAPPEETHATSLRWKANGLDYEFALSQAQAVPGGIVSGTLTIDNSTDQGLDLRGPCGAVARLQIHYGNDRIDVNADSIEPACATLALVPAGRRSTHTISIRAALDAPMGGAFVSIHHEEIRGRIPITIVEPAVRAELVPSDTSLGSGQIIDVELVLRNDTDALIPFRAPGAQCPVMFQAQVVDAGSDPAPFAWPTVARCKPERLLEPGEQVVATAEVEVPEVGRDAELVGAIDIDWPPGFTPPPRVPVTVEPSRRATRSLTWHVEPSDPIEVGSGGTATFELVVTAVEGVGPFSLDICDASQWVALDAGNELPEIAYVIFPCHLTLPDASIADRVPLEVRASFADAEGRSSPLPPGRYRANFAQFAISITVRP